MNNGSRTSSIDSSTGEVDQVREPAADRHAPLLPLAQISKLSGKILFTVCTEEFPFGVAMCTDLSVCTHTAAVFVYHLAGVRQLSDR